MPDRTMWDLADLMTPMAVRAAATLRLADHIAAGTRTAAELASATSTEPDLLARLLGHLVTDGVVNDESGVGRYGLTPFGDELRSDHPSGVRAWIDADGAVGRADLASVHLVHTLRTGEPAFDQQFGRPFWEDLAADPQRSQTFDALMSAQVDAVAPAVADAYDWSSLGHVVDVGGGAGTILRAILTAHPGLRGTVIDLAGPAQAAAAAFHAAGLDDRADAVTASFFDRLPPGAGGYLLSVVLHDWDDDNAARILRRCAEAAGSTGRVFVIEATGHDTDAVNTGMDLRMMTYFLGKERDVTAFTALASRAGLRLESVTPAATRSILELVPNA